MKSIVSLRCLALLVASFTVIGWGSGQANAAGPKDPPPCFDCAHFQTNNAGTQGRMIVVSVGHGGLREVAGGGGCSGCAWKVVPACRSDKPTDTGCGVTPTGLRACTAPAGGPGTLYDTYFAPNGTDWQHSGTVCLGANEKPVSLDGVLAQVRVFVDRLVPPAGALQHQPAGYALVRLPLLMRTDTPEVPAKSFFANAGVRVPVLVKVTPFAWHWKVDGAQVLSTGFPGRAYQQERSPRQEPDFYAAHTFTETGSHQLSVTIDWSATATITGLGTFDVDGFTPRTSPSLPLQVKQARSQLESSQR